MANSYPRNSIPEVFAKTSRVRYPWLDWLDGNMWELKHGVDFQVAPRAFVQQAHAAARNFRMRVRTRTIGDTVWIQAGVDQDEE